MEMLALPPSPKSLPANRGDFISSIEYPSDSALRSRKVISRSKARPTGKYPSWKMGRMIHWESSHELNAFRLLDANPAVREFCEQPLTIHYVLGGEEHKHYPDILVVTAAGRELWEVKSAKEAATPEVVARTRLMSALLPNLGFNYRVVLGEDLGREPRLSTVLGLLRFGRRPVDVAEREMVRRLLEISESVPWSAALDGSLGKNGREILARLCLEGYLTTGDTQPLTEHTRFKVAGAQRRDESTK